MTANVTHGVATDRGAESEPAVEDVENGADDDDADTDGDADSRANADGGNGSRRERSDG
ncbi:MAG: hypothetical protein ABEJ40_01970 [Haloarculaceae archaeon]